MTTPWWIRALAAVAAAATMLATVREAGDRMAGPEPPRVPEPLATVDIVLDPFTSTATEVNRWRAAGRRVWCHLRPAVWEPARPDATRFEPSLIGRPTGDGARWLDLRRWDLLAPIVDDRLALCGAKRFTGVALADEADDATGFEVTGAVRSAFMDGVRGLATERGLEIMTG